MRVWISLFALLSCASTTILSAEDAPKSWIDPATGHRVVQLSREPGSSSFYFHQNAYVSGGDKIVISTRDGLSTIDLHSYEIKPLVQGRAGEVVVGRKTRTVYYFKGDTVCATNIDTGETREIVKNAALRTGSGLTVNADETLLGGSYSEKVEAPALPGAATAQNPTNPANPSPATEPPHAPADSYPGKESMMERRLAAKIPMGLYTINVKTGEVKTYYHSTDWLNHVQFSPTDPTLIMFCHEGPWHKVDRIWTIRTDGSELKLMHKRTMDMEIAGHEFWNPDGKMIWYDLQTPKAKEFWLAGVVLATGKTVRYKVARENWSVHYNVSPDGRLFSGDGGGPNSVAAPGNGQWIYLFHPKDGALEAEKLVDLSKHDYKLEPNATFTPDGKWLVFRSNISGETQVYAVEINKK
ncbi:MAG: hypothetical protein NVS9B4_23590 [Candidatus Acidiferrum sp.]